MIAKPTLVILALIALLRPIPAFAVTYVLNPTSGPTIQETIDDPCTVAGDIIQLQGGTYTENIRLQGKAITILGDPCDPCNVIIQAPTEPDPCIVPGLLVQTVVTCRDNESCDTILDGLTITAGQGTAFHVGITFGGGIYCCNYASPTIRNCIIRNNLVTRHGGGMRCESNASPALTNCQITNNSAGLRGGGIDCVSSSVTLIGCQITTNSSEDGAGISLDQADDSSIENTVFRDNSASSDAGAMLWINSDITIINTRFTFNNAQGKGGGMVLEQASGSMTECVINGNSSNSYGGGLYLQNTSTPNITHCVIAENRSGATGHALYCLGNSNAKITNTIIWGDQEDQIVTPSATPDITYCDVSDEYQGDGNISIDPAFLAAGYWDPNGTTEDISDDFWVDDSVDYSATGDAYRLDPCSVCPDSDPCCVSCIDGGDPCFIPELDDTDIDGHPRFCLFATDIGIDETHASSSRVYNIDLQRWYGTITGALADVELALGHEVSIDPGRYLENITIDTAITLTGLFPDRSDCVEATAIDGSGSSDPTAAAAVMIAGTTTDAAVLTGLTIIGGQGSLVGSETIGGGVCCVSANATIQHCRITDNSATDNGGGIGCSSSEPLIEHCIIKGNSANNGGGVGLMQGSLGRLGNSVIVDNTAAVNGSGVAVMGFSSCEMLFCTVKNNDADGGSSGGTLYFDSTSNGDINSTIIWHSDPNEANGLIVDDAEVVRIAYCDILGGWSGLGHDNIDVDPQFSGSTDDNGTPDDPCDDFWVEDDYSISITSGCINYADPDYQYDLLYDPNNDIDIAGCVRKNFCRADIGAYESGGTMGMSLPGVVKRGSDWYCSIAEAVNQAVADDTITVYPGHYRECVVIKLDGLTLESSDSDDPNIVASTIIDPTGSYNYYDRYNPHDPCDLPDPCDPCDAIYGAAISIVPGNDNVTISGITLTGGRGYVNDNDTPEDPCDDMTQGGGVFGSGVDDLVISHCDIISNIADNGGGVFLHDSERPTVRHCLLAGNVASDYGGGIEVFDCNDVDVRNCIIAGNRALFGSGFYAVGSSPVNVEFCTITENNVGNNGLDGGMVLMNSSAKVTNSIIWANQSDQIGMYEGGEAEVSYCDAGDGGGGDVYVGLGNLNADPCFVALGSWLDNGTPGNYDDDRWIQGDYHLQTEAQTRLIDKAAQGDANGDGVVDLEDFAEIARVWLDDGDGLTGDVNGDGTVDCVDLAVFAGDFLATDSGAYWHSDNGTSACIDAGNPGMSAENEDWESGLTTGENVRVNMGAYGDTAQASPSPTEWANIADMTNDCQVDLRDWAVLCEYWLDEGEAIAADLSWDGSVDVSDVVISTENWLWQGSR